MFDFINGCWTGLCRYILRPPLAKDRLKKVGGNDYELKLKTPWSDGTTSLRLSSMELLERLTSLILPPKAHQVIYPVCFSFKMEKESDAAVYQGHDGTKIGEAIVAIVEKEGKGKYGCVST